MVFVETSFPRGGVSKPVKESVSIETPNIVSGKINQPKNCVDHFIITSVLLHKYLGIRCGDIQKKKGKTEQEATDGET